MSPTHFPSSAQCWTGGLDVSVPSKQEKGLSSCSNSRQLGGLRSGVLGLLFWHKHRRVGNSESLS